jgi:hypothetical protein
LQLAFSLIKATYILQNSFYNKKSAPVSFCENFAWKSMRTVIEFWKIQNNLLATVNFDFNGSWFKNKVSAKNRVKLGQFDKSFWAKITNKNQLLIDYEFFASYQQLFYDYNCASTFKLMKNHNIPQYKKINYLISKKIWASYL